MLLFDSCLVLVKKEPLGKKERDNLSVKSVMLFRVLWWLVREVKAQVRRRRKTQRIGITKGDR